MAIVPAGLNPRRRDQLWSLLIVSLGQHWGIGESIFGQAFARTVGSIQPARERAAIGGARWTKLTARQGNGARDSVSATIPQRRLMAEHTPWRRRPLLNA